MDSSNKKAGDDPEVTVRACATPAGPCVEATSTSVAKAVGGVALGLAAAGGIYLGYKALTRSTNRQITSRSRAARLR